MMKREQKIELAKEIAAEIDAAEGVILTSYKGMTFNQLSAVRSAVKVKGSNFKVVKNTLLKKALNGSNINDLDNHLVESTALIIVKSDFAAVAKDVKKYAKDFQNFKVKVGLMGDTVLTSADVLTLADLPSREELLAKMLATMNAPVTNFVSVLANIPRSFLNVLNAIKDAKN